MELVDPIVFRLTIFVLAIFVGYFVVWSVTPALHTPLMSVTNAISSVIIVGALIAVSVSATHYTPKVNMSRDTSGNLQVLVDNTTAASIPPAQQKDISFLAVGARVAGDEAAALRSAWTSKLLGFFALILASVNIFGGFLVTSRMLAMYKKKEKK